MGLSFGGIVKGIATYADNHFLGGAVQAVGKLLKAKPPTGPTVLGSLPPIFTGQLPAIGGGVVKGGPFGDVNAGGSSTAQQYSYGTRRRYRRMNPMNVRALRRAARRLDAGEKLFRKVFSIRHGGSAGKVTPKRGKKRA